MTAWFYAYALHIQTFPFLFLLCWLVTTKDIFTSENMGEKVLMSQVEYVMYWPQEVSRWSVNATWGLTLLVLS